MLTGLAINREVGGRERVERARAKPSQCVHVSQILKLRKSWNSGGAEGAPRLAVGFHAKNHSESQRKIVKRHFITRRGRTGETRNSVCCTG